MALLAVGRPDRSVVVVQRPHAAYALIGTDSSQTGGGCRQTVDWFLRWVAGGGGERAGRAPPVVRRLLDVRPGGPNRKPITAVPAAPTAASTLVRRAPQAVDPWGSARGPSGVRAGVTQARPHSAGGRRPKRQAWPEGARAAAPGRGARQPSCRQGPAASQQHCSSGGLRCGARGCVRYRPASSPTTGAAAEATRAPGIPLTTLRGPLRGESAGNGHGTTVVD